MLPLSASMPGMNIMTDEGIHVTISDLAGQVYILENKIHIFQLLAVCPNTVHDAYPLMLSSVRTSASYYDSAAAISDLSW